MASKYTKQGFYEGIKEFDARLKRALLHGSWAMRDAARELAKMGENEVKTSISKPGSYKKYWKNGKERMSSHPGTPPAAEPGGNLDSSIYSKVNSAVKRNPAEAEFGSKAPFAADLEFGTPSLQPRPFLRPARQKVRNNAREVVVNHFIGAVNAQLNRAKMTSINIDMEA